MRHDRLDRWLAAIGAISADEIELGLERVARVYARLTHGPLAQRVVTVAGTNGKGTCAHFLERALRAGGQRVGLYTSPHLLRFNERMRVNGTAIDDATLCALFARVEDARGAEALTYFEFTTLAALIWFADCELDVVILEVGLGGRLDAVNIVDPDVAIVTRIGLDHTDWLGATVADIAREKAGVFRADRPAISADPAPPDALREAAEASKARPYFCAAEYACEGDEHTFSIIGPRLTLRDLPRPPGVPLAGFAGALNALAFLDAVPARAQIDAFLRGWQLPGRLQYVPGAPAVLLDVAHNPQAAEVLAARLTPLAAAGRVVAVVGLMSDKDVEGYARRLGAYVDHWYAVPVTGPRGQNASALRARLQAACPTPVTECQSVAGALARARAQLGDGDTIVACGSFQVVGPALGWLGIYSRSQGSGPIEGIEWNAN